MKRKHNLSDFKTLQKAYKRLHKKMGKGCKVSRFYDDVVITAEAVTPVVTALDQWADILRKMGFKIPKPRQDFRIRVVNHYIQLKAKEKYDKRRTDIGTRRGICH